MRPRRVGRACDINVGQYNPITQRVQSCAPLFLGELAALIKELLTAHQ